LFDGEADLIIHHINKTDPRLEFIDLCAVKLIPVVAPGFLRMPISGEITPEQMRDYAAWGHMHDFLVERELREGCLLSIAGRHLQDGRIELTAARRHDMVHGPIANKLWQHIGERAATFNVNSR
jgi:hypothetical protein